MQPVMIVIGTRPEGIKMMPVYFELKKAGIPVVLCSTDQHSFLLQEVFDLFSVTPDISLSLMKPDQDITYLTTAVLEAMKKVYQSIKPWLVLVQGDTTTVMAAALAAFYHNIPVGHVEAGLRTGDMRQPFPEEANRSIVGLIASYHFAPTTHAMGNLLGEGKKREFVFCTGNTVVDALRIIQQMIENSHIPLRPEITAALQEVKKNPHAQKILVTAHRRESFPDGIKRIVHAIKEYASLHSDVFFFYPYHPNPVVMKVLRELEIEKEKNIFLFSPLAYHELAYILNFVDCVATDSGGIQEEAVSLGRPVLVLREKTERMEGVWCGLATIVGTQEKAIIDALQRSLNTSMEFKDGCQDVYGNGYAAQKIVNIIQTLQAEYSNEKSYQKKGVSAHL